MQDYNNIAKRLRKLLSDSGVTCVWLSGQTSIKPSRIYEYCHGSNIPIYAIQKIAYAFGVPTDELLCMDEFAEQEDNRYEQEKANR